MEVVNLGPFHNRPDEWALFQPLVGKSMLELGNKVNQGLTYKAHFEALGYRHLSVDWNGKDGALPMDLQVPLKLGTFDMVSNIGTSEHVEHQKGVWQNICEAMHAGSVLVSTTPLVGDWRWHGDWYPTETFYHRLAALNGLSLDRCMVVGEAPRRMIHARLTRQAEVPFRMPEGELVRNVRQPR